MKKINVLYRTFLGLFAFMMLGSAIPDLLSLPMAVEGFAGMGYPAYLVPFVGFAKTAGVIALFIPGYPRIREWAYAGLVIDLVGATYSIIASGQPLSSAGFMIVPLCLAATAYYFYYKRLRLMQQSPAQLARPISKAHRPIEYIEANQRQVTEPVAVH